MIVNLAKALSLISILLIVCNANESSPTQREGLFPLGDFTFTFESSSLQVTLLADEPMLNSQNVLTQSALIASSSEIYAPDMQLDTTSSCASSLLQERLSLDTTFIQVTLTTGSSNLLTPRKCQHQQSSSVYELEVQREELGTLWGIIRQILKTELGTSHRAFVYFLKPHARQMTTCPEYSFLSGGICIACSVGCTTCTSITACSVCFPGDATAVGYYLASSACVQCASQCLTCDSTHLPCKTCLPGFYINAGNCSPCPLFATACTSTAVTTCQDGFMPSGNSCVPCGVGCATCTSNTACTQCYSSYNLVAGACNSCLPNCGVCSSTLGSCTTCVDGYVWVSPVCVQCPEYCATCSSAALCGRLLPEQRRLSDLQPQLRHLHLLHLHDLRGRLLPEPHRGKHRLQALLHGLRRLHRPEHLPAVQPGIPQQRHLSAVPARVPVMSVHGLLRLRCRLLPEHHRPKVLSVHAELRPMPRIRQLRPLL